MKIMLSVGHSILRNGCCTSADGRPYGGCLEYEYNKQLASKVASYLRRAGHVVDVLCCPEKEFSMSSEERPYKVGRANKGAYDLVVEFHLNASVRHDARGCEVLYNRDGSKEVADRISWRLAKIFRNRGIVKRPNLYMLNSLEAVSVMVESFFCDNEHDYELAKRNDVALAIAEGIHGRSINASGFNDSGKDDFLFRFRIIVDELSIRKGPGVEFEKVGSIKDKLVYTITKTEKAKDGGTWGKLKSGAGWVNVSSNYVNKV